MNYQRIYNQLIERGKVRNLTNRKETYFERHHIVPRCMNGTNDKSNLVNLTAREHFLCHWLLHRIYPNNTSLSHSFFMLSTTKASKRKLFIPSSRAYAEAKEHRTMSKETRLLQSKVRKEGIKNGTIVVTKETCLKKSKDIFIYDLNGNLIVCEKGMKEVAKFLNVTRTQAYKILHNKTIDTGFILSLTKLSKKECEHIYTEGQVLKMDNYCEHCEKYFYIRNYVQYHGDKCKKNPNPSQEILDRRKELSKNRSKFQTGSKHKKHNSPKKYNKRKYICLNTNLKAA
jgi:hypothetical protein